MKRLLFIPAVFSSFVLTAHAEVVADPVATGSVSKVFTVNITQVAGASEYSVAFFRNDVQQVKHTIPATTLTESRNISVAQGDEVCVQVAAINAGGKSATWQECLTVDLALPPVPDYPVVTLAME